MSKRDISLVEYTCPSNRRRVKLNEIYRGNTSISKLELAIAIARTILKDPYKLPFLIYQTGSSLLFLKYVITKDRNLSLIDGANNLFRDFSRSSRIGELAQGVSYLFALNYLKFPCLIDFKDYTRIELLPEPNLNESTPDFVMYDPSGGDIFLLEIKGRWPNEVDLVELKKKFKKALEQCVSGNNYFISRGLTNPVRGTYGIIVDFFEKSHSEITTLRLSDPEGKPNGMIKNQTSLIKQHYVSWFLMLGHLQTAMRLYNGLDIGDFQARKINFNGELFYILDQSESEIDTLLSHILGGNYIYGISIKIWDLLNSPKEINNSTRLTFKSVDKEGIHLFSDGTIVIENDYQKQLLNSNKEVVTINIDIDR
ncbi:hypothetical protein [Bacillus pinisoli]|uniref:hypothetical protein n=1 Tax=Bacillus pinisoli TaxID=2901866 RepID=UPI001FF15099|nr:hypothetical protein [Bacillus pinisoli]